MVNIQKEKKIKVLGIDASLSGTGLCLLTPEFLYDKTVTSTTLTNSLSGMERLLYIEREVERWAKDVDFIVIENYAYDRKFNREVLAELQGIIKRRLFLMEKEVCIVSTQKVKKILTGSGIKPKEYKSVNTKEWVLAETNKNYGIDFKGFDNECDAFGLALIGLFSRLADKNIAILDSYPLVKPVIESILFPKEKPVKKNLHFYMKLPYKIEVYKNEEGTFSAYCPGLSYTVKGNTPNEAYQNSLKEKKERIKELQNQKVRIKVAKKYMGTFSFLKNKKVILTQ